MRPTSPASRLPDVPWDRIAGLAELARSHPDGLVDLSMGAPVDPVGDRIQQALTAAADFPGYPATIGTPRLREAMDRFLTRLGAPEGTEALPTIGSKELIATLAWQLGVGAGQVVVYPEIAYPTYRVGALLAGATPAPLADPTTCDPAVTALIWLNSPSNPTGEVLGVGQLRRIVEWGRANDVLICSDECYLNLAWDGPEPVSVLDERICGDSHDGILAAFSLSKRNNLAGYRAGLLAGDPAIIAELTAIRKNAGFIVPGPMQGAIVAALDDELGASGQKERYRRRRDTLAAAFRQAGWRIDGSHAGLYLWLAATGASGIELAERLARLGILVVPGDTYGAAGADHVRAALTASDERIEAAAARIAAR